MFEYYYKFDSEISKLVNLDYIRRKADENADKRMILVNSDYALQSKFFNYLKPYGLRNYLMLFLQKVGDLNEKIHTDYIEEKTPHHYSCNIICNGQGTMTWFKEQVNGSEIRRHPNDPDNVLYKTYTGLTMIPVDQWVDGKIALVKTGVPHGVKNNGTEDRVCLSIRINDHGWETAKELYKNYFVNELL
jgi:hypothetical protein